MVTKLKLDSGIKKKTPEDRASIATALQYAGKHIAIDHQLSLTTHDFEKMTETELVNCFVELEKSNVKGRLQQCRVLREIRLRFGADDRAFGEHIASMTILSEIPYQTRARMIQVADFFENREIDGIAWSAAIELAAPKNAAVASQVYKEIVGKNVRSVDVKSQIEAMMRQINPPAQRPQLPESKREEPIEGEFIEIPTIPLDEKPEPIVLSLPINDVPIIDDAQIENVAENLLKDFADWSRADRLRLWRKLIGIEEATQEEQMIRVMKSMETNKEAEELTMEEINGLVHELR